MTNGITREQFIARYDSNYDGEVNDEDKARAESIFEVLNIDDSNDVIDRSDYEAALKKGRFMTQVWLGTALRADLLLKKPLQKTAGQNTTQTQDQGTFNSFWSEYNDLCTAKTLDLTSDLKTKLDAIHYAIGPIKWKEQSDDEAVWNGRLAELRAGIDILFELGSADALTGAQRPLDKALATDFENFNDGLQADAAKSILIALVQATVASKTGMLTFYLDALWGGQRGELDKIKKAEVYEKMVTSFLNSADVYTDNIVYHFFGLEMALTLMLMTESVQHKFIDKKLMPRLHALLREKYTPEVKAILGTKLYENYIQVLKAIIDAYKNRV